MEEKRILPYSRRAEIMERLVEALENGGEYLVIIPGRTQDRETVISLAMDQEIIEDMFYKLFYDNPDFCIPVMAAGAKVAETVREQFQAEQDCKNCQYVKDCPVLESVGLQPEDRPDIQEFKEMVKQVTGCDPEKYKA